MSRLRRWGRQSASLGAAVLAVSLALAVPELIAQPPFRASVPYPHTMAPASDNAFDLGIPSVRAAGPAFRWRSLYAASTVNVVATGANVQQGEMAFVGRESGRIVAPGAGYAKLYFRPGTNAGTCALVAVAGTSSTEVVVANNIGAGGCGGFGLDYR